MGFLQALKRSKENQGVALFMVIGAMTILAILVSEFTYLAQVNQKLAYDGVDQVKAFYGAKKRSENLVAETEGLSKPQEPFGAKLGGAAAGVTAPMIPKKILQQIWAYPIVFPLPTIPGMSRSDQEKIKEFNDKSALEGVNFSAIIESTSSKVSINQIAGLLPTPSPSPSPTPTGAASPQAVDGKQALGEFLNDLINERKRDDENFAAEYRDFRLEELMQHLVAWVDPTAEDPAYGKDGAPKAKKAPFYSLSELHMIPGMDDTLYEMFEPHLTVQVPTAINVNNISKTLLRALVPQMRDEEVKEFFEFRDQADADNLFNDEAGFYDVLQKTVSAFRNASAFQQWKDTMAQRGIRFGTEDTDFKITVRSQVNRSIRTIETWVRLEVASGGGGPPGNPPGSPTGALPGATPKADPGIKIVAMRIL